ncbi:alkaline phosphatase family protein [Curtobacterium flaccumfaciens]|uniref:Alkaline phosphatase family protein n=1 Tax=Curtobacterium poinsettiae TaxID=159612 RepID=A0A9Q9T2G1_9MICO|nr:MULTISPECIES: nucleotide pyrophosphatase/phosphodiesterase family protein [Curtobacterium]MBO9041566.1 alkaline phosphatase family protein [Curtobacterium flaccumfaciens pv. flaccumfaciens]MDT0234757.1 alkaline phosphatase family protein [Curtobacterium sp. BRB10]UXN24817.1 alkaline phosphatase family protein [Curtobacterium flaccumfaciens]UYC79656.1 alkaline phosphatase family protein [Curtobacterium flaccumfaciens pv. poinsettiae]
MGTSVPTAPDAVANLADVFPSCLVALGAADDAWLRNDGLEARITLRPARSAIVVLVDGLGSAALAARAGHARWLTGAKGTGTAKKLRSGFPTTTAAALSTLTTGRSPGTHGVIGYSGWNPDTGAVMNLLGGWDTEVPADWFLTRTLFTRAAELGLDPVVVGPDRYRSSGMTANVLGGARYVSADTIPQRIDAALAETATGRSLVYLYVPELDSIGHKHGWQSDRWTAALELLDGELVRLDARTAADVGVLVTADHGVLDVPDHANIAIDPLLLTDVVGVAGDPRCRQLTVAPGTDVRALVGAFRARYGKKAYVASRAEAIEAGWFGQVSDQVLPRIGDVLVVARGSWAFNDDRALREDETPKRMVGQHGAMTDEETIVPLRLAGAFSH